MYLFPSITLSKKAVAAARAKSLSPDAFYCLQLLEETGESFGNSFSTTKLTLETCRNVLCAGVWLRSEARHLASSCVHEEEISVLEEFD